VVVAAAEYRRILPDPETVFPAPLPQNMSHRQKSFFFRKKTSFRNKICNFRTYQVLKADNQPGIQPGTEGCDTKMKKECASKFNDLPVIRNFEICRKCQFLTHAVWENNGCRCSNTCHSFGHPWCKESREPVSKEDFEKVHIYLLNKKAFLHN